jgi:hypothetical protein
MDNSGWIKLHRQVADNPIWLKDTFSDGQAWIDLLLLANHKEGFIHKRGIRLVVPRGCAGWSEKALSIRWKWSRGKVRRFIDFLVHQNMIKIEQQNIKLTTIIQIINYDLYQSIGTTNDTTKRTSDGHQTDTNKKNKNEKNTTYTPEFDLFWSVYPRKVAKGEAWKAWAKQNGNRPKIEVIISTIEKWKQTDQWQKDGGQFIPHPATWINSERWHDDPKIQIVSKDEAWKAKIPWIDKEPV